MSDEDSYYDVQQDNQVTYDDFYNDLAPYGQWINDPVYGNVWMPQAGSDFRPYETGGHWVYTDFGWTWASDYSWGWAAFHYGRWTFDNRYGWLWIPGYEWAPAWVAWRSNADYYGWAPLGPEAGFSVSINLYTPPVNYWCFVNHADVYRDRIRDYCVEPVRNKTIINNTTIINNYYTGDRGNHYSGVNRNRFATGPDPREVSGFTHTNIRPLPVRLAATHGSEINNGSFRIFRPAANNRTGFRENTVPSNRPVIQQQAPVVAARPAVPARQDNPRVIQRAEWDRRMSGGNPAAGGNQSAQPVNQAPVNNRVPVQPPREVPYDRPVPGNGNANRLPERQEQVRVNNNQPQQRFENRFPQAATPAPQPSNGHEYRQMNVQPQRQYQPAPPSARPMVQPRVNAAPQRPENNRNRDGRRF